VAWRNIRDGVMAQRALSATETMEMPQVFLPFATDAKGQTLDEKMLNGKLLRGPGTEEDATQRPGVWHTPGPIGKSLEGSLLLYLRVRPRAKK